MDETHLFVPFCRLRYVVYCLILLLLCLYELLDYAAVQFIFFNAVHTYTTTTKTTIVTR